MYDDEQLDRRPRIRLQAGGEMVLLTRYPVPQGRGALAPHLARGYYGA
jgi:hypothetical protein